MIKILNKFFPLYTCVFCFRRCYQPCLEICSSGLRSVILLNSNLKSARPDNLVYRMAASNLSSSSGSIFLATSQNLLERMPNLSASPSLSIRSSRVAINCFASSKVSIASSLERNSCLGGNLSPHPATYLIAKLRLRIRVVLRR
ncbi:hypothetical protein PUN28_002182 [Cardiocondyla obscurior]|uniref:Uncharacterized protein n=1 Tax=Cardiocondyla obscurior TaxID=286306 RepID=A0AAW2GSY2_9HYME